MRLELLEALLASHALHLLSDALEALLGTDVLGHVLLNSEQLLCHLLGPGILNRRGVFALCASVLLFLLTASGSLGSLGLHNLLGLFNLRGYDTHSLVDLLLLLGLHGGHHVSDGLGLGILGFALFGVELLLAGELGTLLGDLLLGLGAADGLNESVPSVGRANGELLDGEGQLGNLFVVPAVVSDLGLLGGTVLLDLGTLGL